MIFHFFLQHLMRPLKVEAAMVKDLLADQKDLTVLDVGCGEGVCAQFFKKQSYFGLDKNFKAINFAKNKYPDKIFFLSDENLGVKSRTVDLVFIAFAYHFG